MDALAYLKKYLPLDQYEEGVKRYEKGEPLQYIVGSVDFFGLELEVNPHVLIPRFETEELVDKTIQYLQNYPKPYKIADIGTGSGCIAITLSFKLSCKVDAVDISFPALEVAKRNAKRYNVNVDFHHGNLLGPLQGKFTCIISNPPYIGENEKIMDIVKNNEPKIALYAPHDGLYYYEELLKNVKPYLEKKSLIAFEIGQQQGKTLKALAKKYFPNSKVKIEKDLTGVDRFFFLFYEENFVE